jgi:hypothetical protein
VKSTLAKSAKRPKIQKGIAHQSSSPLQTTLTHTPIIKCGTPTLFSAAIPSDTAGDSSPQTPEPAQSKMAKTKPAKTAKQPKLQKGNIPPSAPWKTSFTRALSTSCNRARLEARARARGRARARTSSLLSAADSSKAMDKSSGCTAHVSTSSGGPEGLGAARRNLNNVWGRAVSKVFADSKPFQPSSKDLKRPPCEVTCTPKKKTYRVHHPALPTVRAAAGNVIGDIRQT